MFKFEKTEPYLIQENKISLCIQEPIILQLTKSLP